jgi:hypothetical protein
MEYEEYAGSLFPNIEPGCRCDYKILKKPLCDIVWSNITYNETLNEIECQKQYKNSNRMLAYTGIFNLI